jgi:deazaflavin-dependent oxidoreductase (nitroreductase family)
MTGLRQRTVTGLHTAVLRVGRGRVAGRMGKAPVLLLTTTGRRSGRPRTVPLCYVEDDGDFAVIASNGGSVADPAWFGNLTADPDATVEIRGRTVPVRAEVAEGEERERLWRALTALLGVYDSYREKTSRTIPVVRLRPRTRPTG